MNTVFLSGSRQISRLNDMVRGRLQGIVDRDLPVVVGDANGADRAMQSYLFERGYGNVVVFCVGGKCRNNVGSWPIESIDAPPGLKGRAPYTMRDKAMAEKADIGFVLWDGKSEGSFSNVLELLKQDKKAVVYFAPQKQFVNIKTQDDATRLLQSCEPTASRNSSHLHKQVESLLAKEQTVLDFPSEQTAIRALTFERKSAGH